MFGVQVRKVSCDEKLEELTRPQLDDFGSVVAYFILL